MSKDSDTSNKVYIPAEPGRWAVVTIDWWTVFEVVGFTYDPATDESAPVVITTRRRGPHEIERWNDLFCVLVPAWPGIRYGAGAPYDGRMESVPQKVRAAVDFQHQRWDGQRHAEPVCMIPGCGCGGRAHA